MPCRSISTFKNVYIFKKYAASFIHVGYSVKLTKPKQNYQPCRDIRPFDFAQGTGLSLYNITVYFYTTPVREIINTFWL